MLFDRHFEGEPPRNLNHVFLGQFENGFNTRIGMFMFKNQNDGATLMTSWGRSLKNCHSQGVPFCTEMDGHRRVLIVLNGVPVAVHSLVQSATSLSDVRSVASGAADEVNNRRGLASK